MKHLKKFNTTTEYDQFKSGSEFVLPNVTFVVDGGLYYNPNKSLLTITLNIPDVSNPTNVCYKTQIFSEMIIDGVSMQPTQTYQFTSPGYHTIEFELIDKKHIPNYCFFQGPFPGAINVSYIEKLVIPEGVETIGSSIIPQGQRYLKFVEFPSTFNGNPIILGEGQAMLNSIVFKCSPEKTLAQLSQLVQQSQISCGTDVDEIIVYYPSKYDYSEVIKYLNDNKHNSMSNTVFVGETVD